MSSKAPELNSFAIDTREDMVINAIEIFDTIKQSLVVVDQDLRVVMANSAFYKTFNVTRSDTENNRIYDIGNGQWDIPKLRILLEEIIPKNKVIDDYEVEHDFESIGYKSMLLNAREILRQDNRKKVILLAIEDITSKKDMEEQTRNAETQINNILGKLVGSAERFSGGTAPQIQRTEPKIKKKASQKKK